MDSDTTSASPVSPTWGAPPTEPAHWSGKKTLASVGIAAVLAAGGAAVIYAADSGSGQGGPGGGPGWGGPPGGPGGGPGFGPGGGPGVGGAGAGVSDALHGEFVVSDGHGGYNTELTQTGTVTDISDTSVTARSEDGFTQTYVITTDTRQGRQPVHTGDAATIHALEQNGTNTATVISPVR